MDYLPIRDLFEEAGRDGAPNADPLALLEEAEAVVAVDLSSGRETTMYGGAAAGDASRLDVSAALRVGYRGGADELERLAGLVAAVKGRHDYDGGQD